MRRGRLASVWPPTAAIAAEAGHRRMSPLQAIRQKCLDCTGNQYLEVRLCEATGCPLWPFRSGHHPYTKTRLLEAGADKRTIRGSSPPSDIPPSKTALQQPGCLLGEARRMERSD